MRKNQIKGPAGFTLIELLVVVLIIGILSAVALPQYRKAVFKAKLTEANVIINTYQKGITSYLLANGGFPSERIYFSGTDDSGALDIQVSAPGKNTVVSCNKNFSWSADCNAATHCTVFVGELYSLSGTTCITNTKKGAWEWKLVTYDSGKTWEPLTFLYSKKVEPWKKEILCQWAKGIAPETDC